MLYPMSLTLQATDKSHHHDVAPFLKVEESLTISQAEAHNIISDADWGSATRIEMLFEDDYYQPDELTLEAGKPYILAIKNTGNRRHDISGEKFFSNIAVKKISNKGMEVGAYHIESVHVQKGEEIEIWLVPKNVGEFPFICTVPGHMNDGMEGQLKVIKQ